MYQPTNVCVRQDDHASVTVLGVLILVQRSSCTSTTSSRLGVTAARWQVLTLSPAASGSCQKYYCVPVWHMYYIRVVYYSIFQHRHSNTSSSILLKEMLELC